MSLESNPLFSVIIPAYNYAHRLPRAVESVLLQSGEDYELLVVNDGSTDNTTEVLAGLAGKYPGRFQFTTQRNRGVAATRNFGVDNTKGRYLIFLDADDALIEGGLAAFREAITRDPVDMLIGGHVSVYEDAREKQVLPADVSNSPYYRVRDYLIDKKLALSNGATFLMHRKIFSGYRYPEKFRNSEDIPMFTYALANFTIGSIQAPVVKIYKHKDSLRHNIELIKQVTKPLVEEVFSPSRLPVALQPIKRRFVVQCLLSLSRSCYLKGDYASTRKYYWEAVKADCFYVLKPSYLLKALKAVFR